MTLYEMLPRTTLCNGMNRGKRDIESSSQCSERNAGRVLNANHAHVVSGQSRAAMLFALHVSPTLSALFSHVPVVVAKGSEPKVFDSDAGGIVSTGTVMAHAQAVRNGAVREVPSHAVRLVAPTAESDLAVSLAVFIPAPDPAVASSIDLVPEPLAWWKIGLASSHATSLQSCGDGTRCVLKHTPRLARYCTAVEVVPQ